MVWTAPLQQRRRRRLSPLPLVCRSLRVVNPSPYMAYLQARGCIVVASSPEILCRVGEDGTVTNRCVAGRSSRQEGCLAAPLLSLHSPAPCCTSTFSAFCFQSFTRHTHTHGLVYPPRRPLAGTRRRGKTPQQDAELEADLLADEKECAEHVMLVDLGRNDVGKVGLAAGGLWGLGGLPGRGQGGWQVGKGLRGGKAGRAVCLGCLPHALTCLLPSLPAVRAPAVPWYRYPRRAASRLRS